MAHVVINRFKDKDGHVYEVGKPYPAKGKATQKRLDELSRVNQKYKVSFIKEVEDKKQEPSPKK